MLRGLIAVSISMVLCVFIGVFGWLSIHHVDTQQFLYLFTLIAPTLGLLWNNFKTQKVMDKVDTIEQQTNGTLHEPLEQIQAQIEDVHNALMNDKKVEGTT